MVKWHKGFWFFFFSMIFSYQCFQTVKNVITVPKTCTLLQSSTALLWYLNKQSVLNAYLLPPTVHRRQGLVLAWICKGHQDQNLYNDTVSIEGCYVQKRLHSLCHTCTEQYTLQLKCMWPWNSFISVFLLLLVLNYVHIYHLHPAAERLSAQGQYLIIKSSVFVRNVSTK